MYTIIPTPQFERSYKHLSIEVQQRVRIMTILLSENPRHPSLHTHKRKGEKNIWQARVNRGHRLYFNLEGDTITLLHVGPHDK